MSVCIKDNIQNMNLVIGCTVGCDYCYARNNVKRWHTIPDFSKPEFFEGKLKMMDKARPQNFLLTGMSDLAGWKEEWREEVFEKIRKNPQHQFLFLSKRPDLLDFETDLENAWFGVTVTRRSELWRIEALRNHVRAKHYHVTFEPLFDDPGEVDLSGIDWIVVGTMTGAQSRKIRTEPEWAWSLTDQAHQRNIPVFMKEDLEPIIGDENMVQEFPEAFERYWRYSGHGRSENGRYPDKGCGNQKYHDKVKPAGGRVFCESVCRMHARMQVLLRFFHEKVYRTYGRVGNIS